LPGITASAALCLRSTRVHLGASTGGGPGHRVIAMAARRLAFLCNRQSAHRRGSRSAPRCHSNEAPAPARATRPAMASMNRRRRRCSRSMRWPFVNLIGYHGVLAPNAKWRREVVDFGRQRVDNASSASTPKKVAASHNRTWAELMRHPGNPPPSRSSLRPRRARTGPGTPGARRRLGLLTALAFEAEAIG